MDGNGQEALQPGEPTGTQARRSQRLLLNPRSVEAQQSLVPAREAEAAGEFGRNTRSRSRSPLQGDGGAAAASAEGRINSTSALHDRIKMIANTFLSMKKNPSVNTHITKAMFKLIAKIDSLQRVNDSIETNM